MCLFNDEHAYEASNLEGWPMSTFSDLLLISKGNCRRDQHTGNVKLWHVGAFPISRSLDSLVSKRLEESTTHSA